MMSETESLSDAIREAHSQIDTIYEFRARAAIPLLR